MVQTVKLVVLGDGGVGKTALTLRLALNYFGASLAPSRCEDSYRKHAIIDGQPYMLEILDTAGQEEYTALRDQWIREGEGFLIVYSTTSRASFDRVERFRHQVARVKDSDSVPVVLVGNKIDRVHEREVETRHGEELAKRLGCAFIETSAKTRVNLEEAYFMAVRMIEARKGGTAAKPVRQKTKKQRKCSIL
ncbi:uncharacterized protein RHOBADRAFT_34690 [Rhodotorula graminis WP1]|uniref:Small G-protein Ras2 n=1 Tax=Rhodotorula graminis (strain WP1) TaxID=578459 RepID=A0A194SCS4_RHOGW|nr:uncharacterized protein RHOBADRAFT_34690 [Rhodotorula graminis WP1]KPV77196.1 hypothetical protein RHOBADRAFT_34690 [Rhodotorula graminis WP1]